MLINDTILINITNKNKRYYSNLGYNISDTTLSVRVIDLPINSIFKVLVKCEKCGEIKEIQYRNYLKSKKSYDKYFCNKCCYNKSQETYKTKNNMSCIFFDDNFIKRNKDRCDKNRTEIKIKKNIDKINKKNLILDQTKAFFIKKSEVIHSNNYDYSLVEYKSNKIKVEIICNICGKHFFQSPSNHSNHKQNCSFCDGKYKIIDNSFIEYRNEVRKETYKFKKELLKNWNGYDFYDNEFIRDNFNLDRCDNNHPSVD
jgi:formylmethanofuran dehydrogenase subunit E